MANTVITVPANGVLAQNDNNGKPLNFEFKDGNNTAIVEGSDGLIYTAERQPQQVILNSRKKDEDSSLPRINDPYYQRIVANRPKAEGDTKETTEARESKEFGKPTKRTDIK
jgi:hypothetical protein